MGWRQYVLVSGMGGAGRIRIWAVVFLIASVVLTGLETLGMIHERQHFDALSRTQPN
jgi:hypothetical protein